MKNVKRTRGLHLERMAGISAGMADADCPRAGPEQPAIGHHDRITEVAMCHTTQHFALTGSSMGVIKVWK
jgi:hypothetical protein